MSQFQINKKISLSNCSITKLLQNPYNPEELISTYYNGSIHIWKLPQLSSPRKILLSLSKLTSVVSFQNSKTRGFLLGVRNGQLMMLNENFQLISTTRLHSQSISQIIVLMEYVITVGYDGKVLFLNKQTFQIIRTLQFEYPFFSAVQFNNQLYLSSIKSYIVNLETYEFTENKRFNKFFIANNRVYGSSDERGLSVVNSNSNNYLPAEFLLLYQRRILIFSEKSICVADKMDKFQYKAKKYSQLSSGESMVTGFTCQKNIYVGGNEGNIYWITQNIQ